MINQCHQYNHSKALINKEKGFEYSLEMRERTAGEKCEEDGLTIGSLRPVNHKGHIRATETY